MLSINPQIYLLIAGRAAHEVEFKKRDIIYSQSDPARDVFYILKGGVRLSVASHRGKQAVVAFLRAGDFFGEGCIGDQRRRISTATATSKCLLVRTNRNEMISLLKTQVTFTCAFINYLIQKNGRTQEDLLAQIFDSADRRLARVLLQLGRITEKTKKSRVLPYMSQETLSRIIGTTRSHVNVFMAEFRNRGYINQIGPRKWRVNPSLLKVVLAK